MTQPKQCGNDYIHPSCKADLAIAQMQEIYDNRTKKSVIALAQNLNNNPIKLSVVMPFFRAGGIAWLPFESLCRQEGITFNWEIIIIEENFDNPFGLVAITDYIRRLQKVHCARITYINLSAWLPLSAKWYYLIQEVDPTSLVVAFNAADGYCSPHRLNRQYKALHTGEFNWYKLGSNIVYDIESNLHVKRLLTDKSRNDTPSRACSIELAKTLPLAAVKKSVDGWSYNTFEHLNKLKVYYDEDDSLMGNLTINVNGLNNISINRHKRIRVCKPPLYPCCRELTKHVPLDIVKQLNLCRSKISAHIKLRNASKIKLT